MPRSIQNSMPIYAAETNVIDVTLSLDTSAYADGDVLADTQEVAGLFPAGGGCMVLQSVTVLDEDDQGVGLDILFLDSNVSLGTENSAPSISDANARSILGRVSVTASDYFDLGGSRIATIAGLGLVLKGAAGATSVWVAAVTRSGTPTYTAAGLKLKLGVI